MTFPGYKDKGRIKRNKVLTARTVQHMRGQNQRIRVGRGLQMQQVSDSVVLSVDPALYNPLSNSTGLFDQSQKIFIIPDRVDDVTFASGGLSGSTRIVGRLLENGFDAWATFNTFISNTYKGSNLRVEVVWATNDTIGTGLGNVVFTTHVGTYSAGQRSTTSALVTNQSNIFSSLGNNYIHVSTAFDGTPGFTDSGPKLLSVRVIRPSATEPLDTIDQDVLVIGILISKSDI